MALSSWPALGASHGVRGRRDVGQELVQRRPKYIVLYDAADLLDFKELVNDGTSFSGKTVSLGANIDISDIEWEPIGVSDGENDRAFQARLTGRGTR